MSDAGIPEIALFAAAVLLSCLFALTVSGMFPSEYRPPALRSPLGSALLYAAMAIVATLLVHAIWFAVTHIAWPAAVIAGGFAILIAPFAHAVLPRSLQDDRAGIIGLALVGLLLHGAVGLA